MRADLMGPNSVGAAMAPAPAASAPRTSSGTRFRSIDNAFIVVHRNPILIRSLQYSESVLEKGNPTHPIIIHSDNLALFSSCRVHDIPGNGKPALSSGSKIVTGTVSGLISGLSSINY